MKPWSYANRSTIVPGRSRCNKMSKSFKFPHLLNLFFQLILFKKKLKDKDSFYHLISYLICPKNSWKESCCLRIGISSQSNTPK